MRELGSLSINYRSVTGASESNSSLACPWHGWNMLPWWKKGFQAESHSVSQEVAFGCRGKCRSSWVEHLEHLLRSWVKITRGSFIFASIFQPSSNFSSRLPEPVVYKLLFPKLSLSKARIIHTLQILHWMPHFYWKNSFAWGYWTHFQGSRFLEGGDSLIRNSSNVALIAKEMFMGEGC